MTHIFLLLSTILDVRTGRMLFSSISSVRLAGVGLPSSDGHFGMTTPTTQLDRYIVTLMTPILAKDLLR